MLCIIANETAGNGNGARALRDLRALLDQMQVPYSAHSTTGPGDAMRLSDAAVSAGNTDIVCLGGDGTIFETVNGLAGRFATLFFVPCGTGNDFVKMLPLPKDPIAAFRAQWGGAPRRIDVGRVNEYHFLNVSGCGFDAEVLRQATRFKKLGKGLLPYVLGIFAALHRFRPMTVELSMDGGQTESRGVTILSVGNGSYFGGGMKAGPHAIIDDGLFDVMIADSMNRRTVLKLLTKFISGQHTSLPMVHEYRCKRLTIRCPGMTLNMDGELRDMDEARYELLPGAVEIRLREDALSDADA